MILRIPPISAAIIILLSCLLFFPGCGSGGGQDGGDVTVPHFNDSTPLAGDVYAAQPINITLNFDLDLLEESTISVTGPGGTEWAEGEVLIEDNNTALKRILRHDMPDGEYRVAYTASLVDGMEYQGSFVFFIDSSLRDRYTDLRGESEVTVSMVDLAYNPRNIIVSPGTMVTWINEEDPVHFVNTETHPEHTYFTPQNSLELARGDTFSVVFEIPGQYDYHCSAHYHEGMTGSILVLR